MIYRSRSPNWYFRRHGWVDDSVRPGPRLDPARLAVQHAPIADPPGFPGAVLSSFDGVLPSQRGLAAAWMPPSFDV